MNDELEKDLTCPICMELMVRPQDTICGHTYCEKCLALSVLSKPTCPVCRVNIGKQELYPSKSLTKIIERSVEMQDKSIQKSYRERIEDFKAWEDERKLKNVEVDMEIDVKDTENIWCVAIVKEIIKNRNHSDTLLIHYKGWNEIYDEYICTNSRRLAPLGVYTSRNGKLSRYSKIRQPHFRQPHNGLYRVWRRGQQKSQSLLYKRDFK